MADFRSFYWSAETTAAQIFSGDGVCDLTGGGSLTTSQAKRGTKSFAGTGTGFPLAEFNTNEPIQTANPPSASNPDFDFTIGTIVAWVYWTGVWPSGNAQLFSVKNENGLNTNIFCYARGGTSGSVRLAYGSTATMVTATGLTADTWHRVTARWNFNAAGTSVSPYLSLQIDNGAAVVRLTAMPAIDDSVAAETQILVGNDTAVAMNFFVDEFSILKQFVTSATGYTISASSSGTTGEASTAFTVTATGGLFDDNLAITLTSDNGSDTLTPTITNGGEWSGGTGAITVTPPPGTDSFTFTVTRSTDGTSTITPTNNAALSNPSAVTYTAAGGGETATDLTVAGVTFTLAGDPTVGQYANGDYWVVGPVTITSISPASATVEGWTKNGTQVNPVAGVSTHGFDSSIEGAAQGGVYDAALNLDPGHTGSPLVVETGTVCKAISQGAAQASGGSARPQLTDMAYLTVVESAPEVGAFRPAPVGTDKTSYWKESDLDYSFLRSITPLAGAPSLAAAEASLERPWVEFCSNPAARWIHPQNNQSEYGRDSSFDFAKCAWHLNFNHTNEQKRTLFVRMVQYGLDIYGSVSAGMTYPDNGAINPGRKLPMLIAGRALNDSSILAWGNGAAHLVFHEDRQTWLVTEADVGRTVTTGEPGFPREPYTEAHVGLYEWGEKHASQPVRDGSNWDANYRITNIISLVGHALLAHVMGLRVAWGWEPFFGYYRRAWGMEKASPHGGITQIQTVDYNGWTLLEAEFDDTSPTPTLTGYTLTGPASGRVGSARTFTISAVPDGAKFDGTETFTPVNTGLTGTFSAATVTPTAGASSVTFTFTGSAASSGTIGVTDNQGWTDPAAIAFTVAAPSNSSGGSFRLRLGLGLGVTGGGGGGSAALAAMLNFSQASNSMYVALL